MPVAIPPELAKGLVPRKPEDVGNAKRVTPKKAWERVREAVDAFGRGRGGPGFEIAFVRGVDAAPPDLQPRMKALAEIVQRAQPPATWSLDVASGLITYVRKAFDSIEAAMGLPFALEALVDSLRYDTKWHYVSGTAHLALQHRSGSMLVDSTLRARVLGAPPDVRAACKAVGERLWPAASPGQKVTLAHTFFEEVDWANEVARRFVDGDADYKGTNLEALYAIVRDAGLMREVIAKRTQSRSYLDVVASLGDEAFDLVAEAFKAPRDEFDLKHAATSLAVFDDVRAGELLASGIGSVKVRPSLADFCGRFPDTARAALEPVAKGKGRAAKLAGELLASIARAKASADTAGDGGVAEEAHDGGARSEEATPDELPWILVRPPWLARKKLPKRTRPKLAVAMLEREERVNLDAGLVQAALDAVDPSAPIYKPDGNESELRITSTTGARLDDDVWLENWDQGGKFAEVGPRLPDHVAYLLHRFGTKAIGGFVHFLGKRGPRRYQYVSKKNLLAVDSPRLAPRVAERLGDDGHWWSESWGPFARRWLRVHPETAVIGLVPAALAGDEASEKAEAALRWMRDQGIDIAALARPYGIEVCGALEELLAWDARFDLPRIAKLPPSFRPESLTRPKTKSGKLLPLSAVEHLATMLSFTDKRFPYPGIADVRAACDARSLAEFAWDLARSWEMAGSKGSTEWMMDALIHLADDEVVRRTTPAMRSEAVGEVLQIIGTDAAVMELVTIGARAASGNSGYSWAMNVVSGRIERIANERGTTGRELEDSVLPVSETDYKDLKLDYGGRVFEVRFDERLEAFIAGEDGARLRGLPPAKKTDDPKKVEEARRIWQDVREEVSAVVARRLLHLEQAMVHGSTWTPGELVRRYVEHPLLGHLGRSLVWEQGGRTFRVIEDGSFATSADEPFALDPDPDAPVRLAHPARMRADEVERWRELLFDYRIVQPFPQIGRAVRALSDAERSQRVFHFSPQDLTPEELLRRTSERGWSNGKKLLVRGEVHMASTNAAGDRVSEIKLTFEPAWLDFDAVEMAEALADFER